jgi:hypothetical protein
MKMSKEELIEAVKLRKGDLLKAMKTSKRI